MSANKLVHGPDRDGSHMTSETKVWKGVQQKGEGGSAISDFCWTPNFLLGFSENAD